MPPRPTIVCGSNYGRVYVPAIRALPDELTLVGLLARGSPRSTALAAEEGVPLFVDPDDLPEDVQVACVAVPSAETELIPRLLDRGIHVLSDHPVAVDSVSRSLRNARQRERVFHVNPHFSALEAPRAFIQGCRTLSTEVRPLFVDLFTADRMLYAALDTLRQALGPLGALALGRGSVEGPIHTLHGRVADVPCSIRAQGPHAGGGAVGAGGESPDHPTSDPRDELPDGSPGYFADLRLSVSFPMGTLTLLSLSGPVTWTWTFTRALPADPDLTPSLLHEGVSAGRLGRQREEANIEFLQALLDCAGGAAPPPHQDPDHLLDLARAWEHLGRVLT
ncbi:MAG TPA: Gfo/Idh/MocA family oxidoreductase [Longimicrobiales bacterium]|nr:Gfo/Idh/MocA family oxidoreductase [Longimicrobiales bacterium]